VRIALPAAALLIGLVAPALVGPALVGPALAGQACDGAIQASALQTLPSPLVVAVQDPRNNAQSKTVVASFEDGLRAGGVTVRPDGASVLHLTFLVSTANGGQQHQYADFSWASAPEAASGPPPTLTVTAGLSTRGLATLIWVASVECKVKTRDPLALAQELGQLVGQVLGQHLDQKSF
jgi:hypothetical protein